MAERFEVIAFKKTQNGKTFAVRLGSAQQRNDGQGFNCYLDAIPAPEDGQWVISIVPPRQREQQSDTGAPWDR